MSYVLELRELVGSRPLLVPGGRAVVSNENGEVLFHRRRDLDLWDLPGGSAEIGESAESCVIREVREETGLTIESFVPIGLGSNPHQEHVEYPNGDVIQGFSLVLASVDWSGDLAISDESTELRFMALDQLPSLRPNIAATINCFVQFNATGDFQLF